LNPLCIFQKWYLKKQITHLCLGKVLDELGQTLGTFQGNRVVVAGTDTTDAAVALEASQAAAGSLLEESLLGLVDVAALGELALLEERMWPRSTYLGNAEADIHLAAHRLVRHNAVDVRMSLESSIEQVGLLLGNLLLAINLVGERSQKLFEHLAGNVDARDR